MNRISCQVLLIIFVLLFTPQIHAAKVAKIKGKRIFVLLKSPNEARPGDIFLVLNKNGKRQGTVQILKVKGKKAMARLKSGKAKKGLRMKFSKKGKIKAVKKRAPRRMEEPMPSLDKFAKFNTNLKSFYGVMAGYSLDSMTAAIDQGGGVTQDATMEGNGFSGRIFFDYPLWESIGFRGMLGIENFTGESEDKICGASNDEICDIEISYISLDLWGRWLLMSGSFRPWLGVGFNLLFPSSKLSTAIEEDSITSTSVIAPGIGVDWYIKRNMYIPIQFEYGLFPSSESVSASYIAARLGVAFMY